MDWKKGIAYDFDGVLGDTEKLQFKKWNIVLKDFGVEISEEEYVRDYCGKSSRTEIPQLLLKRYPQITISQEELVDRTQKVLKKLFETEAKLMPGAKEVLLETSKKFRIAICSGETTEQLEMKLKSVGIAEFFPEEVRSNQEKAGKGKPDPAMYQLAVRQLGLKPTECIAIEDTSVGVESAVAAGLFTIALPNKWTSKQDFSKASLVILEGLPYLLENLL